MTCQSAWAVTQDSSANTAQTLTKAAVSDASHYVEAIEVAISVAAATGDITVVLKDGTTSIWKSIIGNAAARGERTGISFTHPVKCAEGAAVSLEVSAGGAGCVTHANIAGFTA